MFRIFGVSIAISIVGLVTAFFLGGLHGLFVTFILCVLEISLSFDNAIVNASILKNMSPVWQKRFLTWGILIAVFGMRLIFPVLIVSIVANLGFVQVVELAINTPEVYKDYLELSHVNISAFGGMFLLMVFLTFILDPKREIHWLTMLERRLCLLGKLESIEIIFALLILLLATSAVQPMAKVSALTSGIIGIVVYVLIHGLTELMSYFKQNAEFGRMAKHAGLMSFVYLEVLDATFSFDGVIGAFAITKDVVLIMIGLGIGAFFVRSITVYLVERKTLQNLIYLEHGAHYALGALACIMLYSMSYHVSEIIVGCVGLVLILLSYVSSLAHARGTA